ncbi:hypothetical protein KI387_002679, partial [Taxus chinensis]
MGWTPPLTHQQKKRVGRQAGMDSQNSPVESIISSVCAFGEACSPVALESMIRGAAKDLESGFFMAKMKRKVHCKKQKMERTNNVEANQQNLDPSMNDFLSLEEPKKDSAIKLPLKAVWGNLFQNGNSKSRKTELLRKTSPQTNVAASEMQSSNEEKLCGNCLFTAVTRTLLGCFFQAIPSHFKTVKKCFGKHTCHTADDMKARERNVEFAEKTGSHLSIQLLTNGFSFKNTVLQPDGSFLGQGEKLDSVKEGDPSFEVFFNFLLECCLQTGLKLQQDIKQTQKKCVNEKHVRKESEASSIMDIGQKPSFLPDFKGMGILNSILKGNKRDKNSLSAKPRFARIGEASDILVDSSAKEDSGGQVIENSEAESNYTKKAEGNPAQKLTTGIFNASLTNVEKLKSTLSAIPLTELKERLHQIGKSQDYPDLKQLFSFRHVFDYAQTEGRKFFEELDRDGDGRVTLEDLEVAMRKRRLPRHYAHEFLRRTRTHMFAKSFGWEQFLSLMKQKEPTIVSAYISLSLNKSGTLKKSQVLATLKSQGLPATEENVVAMMRILNADTEGFISYGHFHNFMLLLPPEHLQDEAWSLWFKAATVVAGAPPVVIPAGNVLKAALVGGLTCAISTSLLHPVDTMK